jgi:hypothetical protein
VEVFFIESHSSNSSKNYSNLYEIYKPLTNKWLDFYNFKRRYLAIQIKNFYFRQNISQKLQNKYIYYFKNAKNKYIFPK